MKTAFCFDTFAPITHAHRSIVATALELFDSIRLVALPPPASSPAVPSLEVVGRMREVWRRELCAGSLSIESWGDTTRAPATAEGTFIIIPVWSSPGQQDRLPAIPRQLSAVARGARILYIPAEQRSSHGLAVVSGHAPSAPVLGDREESSANDRVPDDRSCRLPNPFDLPCEWEREMATAAGAAW